MTLGNDKSWGDVLDASRRSRRDFLDVIGREGIPLYDPADEELAGEWTTAQSDA